MSEARPPFTRTLSSRLSQKVSCETLILSIADSKFPCDFQRFYFSDDNENNGEIEADSAVGSARSLSPRCQSFADPSHLGGDINSPLHRPLHRPYGELENSGHNHGSLGRLQCGNLDSTSHRYGNLQFPHDEKPFPTIGRQHKALQNLLSKVLLRRHTMSDSIIPAGGRKRKPLRKFLTSAHWSNGGLVSHSGPMMLAVGSHSGPLNNVNCKAPGLLKASSIIPRNAVIGKMNTLLRDPSSPKVTCLGRVRSRQQSRRNTATPSCVVADDGNMNERLLVCWPSKVKGREKKLDLEAVKSEAVASASFRQGKREKVDAFGRGLGSDRRFRIENSTTRDADNAKLAAEKWKENVTLASRCIMEEGKGLSEVKAAKSEETSHCYLQNEQTGCTEQVSAPRDLCLDMDVFLNLSRFGSEESRRCFDGEATSSSVLESTSHRLQRQSGEGSVSMQVPPRNALMLMRNSGLKKGDRSEQDVESTCFVQAPPKNALLMMRNRRLKVHDVEGSTCVSSALSKELQRGHEMQHQDSSSGRQRPLSVANNSDRLQLYLCSQRSSAMHRHASFPQTEVTSLWQRRGLQKPIVLEIKRPNRSESKRPTTA